MIILEFLKMPKSRRDRTIALTRTSKKQGIEHKEKVDSKNIFPVEWPRVSLEFKFHANVYFSPGNPKVKTIF